MSRAGPHRRRGALGAESRDRPQDAKQKADEAHRKFAGENSDFSSFINLFRAYREQAESLSKGKLRAWCEAHFVSFTRMREWLDIHAQLEETAKESGFARRALKVTMPRCIARCSPAYFVTWRSSVKTARTSARAT